MFDKENCKSHKFWTPRMGHFCPIMKIGTHKKKAIFTCIIMRKRKLLIHAGDSEVSQCVLWWIQHLDNKNLHVTFGGTGNTGWPLGSYWCVLWRILGKSPDDDGAAHASFPVKHKRLPWLLVCFVADIGEVCWWWCRSCKFPCKT